MTNRLAPSQQALKLMSAEKFYEEYTMHIDGNGMRPIFEFAEAYAQELIDRSFPGYSGLIETLVFVRKYIAASPEYQAGSLAAEDLMDIISAALKKAGQR